MGCDVSSLSFFGLPHGFGQHAHCASAVNHHSSSHPEHQRIENGARSAIQKDSKSITKTKRAPNSPAQNLIPSNSRNSPPKSLQSPCHMRQLLQNLKSVANSSSARKGVGLTFLVFPCCEIIQGLQRSQVGSKRYSLKLAFGSIQAYIFRQRSVFRRRKTPSRREQWFVQKRCLAWRCLQMNDEISCP